MRKHPFTLLEILIVFVVIGLIMAVALPALSQHSDRVAIENALTGLRAAITETAMRARATGHPLTLTLQTENASFEVGAGEPSLDKSWQPPSHDSDETLDNRASFLQAKASYPLADDIEWTPDSDAYNDDGNIVFTFFPDGQAAAREVAFSIRGHAYALRIDRITATPVIVEFADD